MTIRNKTTNIYTEWLPLIDTLPNEIAGVIFKNILKYQNGEDIKSTFPVWVFIKTKIDEYNNKGSQISEKRRENGRLGGLAKASKCQQKLANDGKSSNKIKENKRKENKYIIIDDDFNFGNCEEVRDIANTFDLSVLDSLQKFLVEKLNGQKVDVDWIKKQAERFANGN